ncbi:hypothetical protein WR24_09470 [Escherichia coli]|nr:hypothetical protein BHT24_21645 [Escherichia coli]KHD46456.1 hypothetical protein LS41_21635 [Escherichia coli]KHD58040.1 hypothetical protein LS42_09180 [Escherichia coli]KLG72362.1 hypothetical protein WR24_09470 [Escherichia coli]KLG75456.1 hypothetical protein WR12_19230 [Escherichia coli]
MRTFEAMLMSFTQTAAARATLTAVSRVNIFNHYSDRTGFIFDKRLKLTPCPAVQAGTDPFTSFYPVTNMSQIFQYNCANTRFSGSSNDNFTRFVVGLFYPSHLFTGDLPQLLFCTLAAIGLETTTEGKVTISFVTKLFTTKQLTQTVGGKVVFSHINAHRFLRNNHCCICYFNNKIEEPETFTEDKLCLFGVTGRQHSLLMFADDHWNTYPPIERVKRQAIIAQTVRLFIEVNTGTVEANRRHSFRFMYVPPFFLRFIGFTNRKNNVAAHLASKGGMFTQITVNHIVQPNPVPDSMFTYNRHKTVTGISIHFSQDGELFTLFYLHIQSYARCPQHRLPPFVYMSGTLNITLYCPGANIDCCTHIIRSGPQIPTPKPFFYWSKKLKQPTCCTPFQNLNGIGYYYYMRKADKQVVMVWPERFGYNRTVPLCAKFVQRFLDSALAIAPTRISCRYLGHYIT